MKVNFYSFRVYASLRFIIFFLSVFFNVSRAIAQFSIPYQGEPIDASLKDTANFSPCRFPYSVSNMLPGNGETVQWKVIKGTVSIIQDTQANMEVRDIMGDTAILTYTINNPNKVARLVDTLWLFRTNSLPCSIIDRTFPTIAKCGDTITLYSKLPMGYLHSWNTLSPNVEIINSTTSRDIKIKILGEGSLSINVYAMSPSGYNNLSDTYSSHVFCDEPTVTQADAGPDQNLAPCQFPYTLFGNAPASGETVKWEVIEGTAYLQNVNNRDVKILDISNGARLKYTISKGISTSSDYVIISTESTLANICNPVISNTNPKCGDTISINFTWNTQQQYLLQWSAPSGLSPISQTASSAWFKVNSEGQFEVLVSLKSNYNTFSKKILINATCTQTNPVTKANAGNDIYITPCQFPYTLWGNTGSAGETVKWEVIPGSGIAYLSNDNTPNAILNDALNGTRLKYTITNGSQTSTDTLTVNVNSWLGLNCEPFVSHLAPKCGDTVNISFNIPNFPPYKFQWEFPGITPYYISGSSAGLILNSAGNFVITVTITSPYLLNTFTKSITLNSTCSSVTHANVGPDRTVYCNNSSLNANMPSSGETGEWKLISGTAVITQKNNPKTSITNINSDKLVLVWTITNGTSSSSDTLTLTINALKIIFPNMKNETCGKGDGSVQVLPTGGLPAYNILWENGSEERVRGDLPSGTYYVSVKDQSGCEVKDSVRISDNCNEVKIYSVEGNVYAEANLYNFGLALLIKQNGSVPVPISSVHVKNGYYKFTGVEKGDYTVYVLPYKDSALSILDDYFLPTYYVNKVSLSTANSIQVKGNTYSVDIKLASRKQWNRGPNNVQANIDIKNGVPVSTLPVLLFNENNELVDAEFLNNTSVTFDNLTSGKYYMHIPVEGIGYRNTEMFDVSLSTTVIDIDTEEGTLTGNESAIFNSIQAYPNPFNDILIIEGGNVVNDCKAKLIELVSAKEIKEFTLTSGQNQLSTDELVSGLYIIQIVSGTKVKNIFLIKH